MRILISRSIILIFFMLAHTTLISGMDEARLYKIAIQDGFGYKFANLVMTQELIAKLNQELGDSKTPHFAVPQFAGISSPKIQQFINKFGKLNIEVAWAELIKKYFPNEEIKQQTLKEKSYPAEFLRDAEDLSNQIAEACIRVSEHTDFEESFSLLVGDEGKNLIGRVLDQTERLMVRSTGKEDTKKLANAGGNESIPNVAPQKKDIMLAIGQVVSSYFASKSLKQRLGAGDESIFDPVPFTPVLLQRMIGEVSLSKIPKCGVMFTEDAEGSVSRINPGLTSGITLIQASYGHNEAVVNSRIPVDSYYVNKQKVVFPIIKYKTHRMQPLPESGKLALIKNDSELIKKPALLAHEVSRLKEFADALEEYYQGPMDVEFVVSTQDNIIYIVQARPIVHKEDLPKPSYLVKTRDISPQDSLPGIAIGVAGGGLRLIHGADEIILAPTINRALSMYQDDSLTPDTNKVAAVDVGKDAPITSHEATSFRSEGKPVLYTEGYQIIEEWLKRSGARLIISPQQGLIINWHQQIASIDDVLKDPNIARLGWATYPAPPFISLSNEFLPGSETLNETKEFLSRILIDDEKVKKASVKELLNYIRTEDSVVAVQSLRKLHDAINMALNNASSGIVMTIGKKSRIALMKLYVLYLTDAIKNQLNLKPQDPLYPNRLLPVRFLENLLTQHAEHGRIVDAYSAHTLIGSELLFEQKIMGEFKGRNLDSRSIQYLRLRELAQSPRLKATWQSFVLSLHELPNQDELKNQFENIIKNLFKLDLLSVWLTTSFAKRYAENPNQPGTIAQNLINELESQSIFLSELIEKKNQIISLAVDSFSEPKNFLSQWNIFHEAIVSYFLSHGFLNSYKEAKPLAKLAAGAVMARLVDAFDLSIKAVKGSRAYDPEQKIERIHSMLKLNAELFKKWIAMVPDGAIVYNTGGGSLHNFMEYIDAVLGRGSYIVRDLEPTPGFNVSAFTIGSGLSIMSTDPKPNTLEDIFTMLHQCLLVTLSALNAKAGIADIERPLVLQEAEDMLKEVNNAGKGSGPGKMSLIGVDLSKETMTLDYNLPLGAHSMQASLRYQQQSNNVVVTIKFFGHNPERWYRIQSYLELIGLLGRVRVLESNATDNGVVASLIFDQNTNINDIKNGLQQTVDMTYGQRVDTQTLLSGINNERRIEIAESIIDKIGDKSLQSFPFIMQIAYRSLNKPAVRGLIKKIVGLPLPPMGIATISNTEMVRVLEYAVEKKITDDFYKVFFQLYQIWQRSPGDPSVAEKITKLTQKLVKKDMARDTSMAEEIATGLKTLSLQARQEGQGHNSVQLLFKEKDQASSRDVYGAMWQNGAALFDVTCQDIGKAPCTVTADIFMPAGMMDEMVYVYSYGVAHTLRINDLRFDSMNQKKHLVVTLGTSNDVESGLITELFQPLIKQDNIQPSMDKLLAAASLTPDQYVELATLLLRKMDRNALRGSMFFNERLLQELLKSQAGFKLIASNLDIFQEHRIKDKLLPLLHNLQNVDEDIKDGLATLATAIMATKEQQYQELREKILQQIFQNRMPGYLSFQDAIAKAISMRSNSSDVLSSLLTSADFSNPSSKPDMLRIIHQVLSKSAEKIMKTSNETFQMQLVNRVGQGFSGDQPETQKLALEIFEIVAKNKPSVGAFEAIVRNLSGVKSQVNITNMLKVVKAVVATEPYKSNQMIQNAVRMLEQNEPQ